MISIEEQIQELLDDVEYLESQKATIYSSDSVIRRKALEEWNRQIDDLIVLRKNVLMDLGYVGS